jgi:hypothetical protein
MSRVRLTGPYRYLIYVTPDYAIVEGLDLGTGQEAMRVSRHSGSPISLFRSTRVGKILNGDDQ